MVCVCVCVILKLTIQGHGGSSNIMKMTLYQSPQYVHQHYMTCCLAHGMEITGAYLDERRDDCINGFRDDLETVLTVLTQNTSTNECEDGHDIMQHQCLQQQKQCQVIPTEDLATKTPHAYDVWSW